jgi:hypothetical protein
MIMAGLLIAVYIIFVLTLWRRKKQENVFPTVSHDIAGLVLQFALLAALILIITDKVLSPQYLIWLCPLIALVSGKWRNEIWIMFIVSGICTQFIFPHNYTSYQFAEPVPVIVETTRNLLLMAITIMVSIKAMGPCAANTAFGQYRNGNKHKTINISTWMGKNALYSRPDRFS